MVPPRPWTSKVHLGATLLYLRSLEGDVAWGAMRGGSVRSFYVAVADAANVAAIVNDHIHRDPSRSS